MVEQQCNVAVRYDGVVVGMYAADLLVENEVLVELKAINALDPIHRAQCMNYLKATGLRLCLLLNFGHPRLEIKRLANGQIATSARVNRDLRSAPAFRACCSRRWQPDALDRVRIRRARPL
jgi:hypothetical protein